MKRIVSVLLLISLICCLCGCSDRSLWNKRDLKNDIEKYFPNTDVISVKENSKVKMDFGISDLDKYVSENKNFGEIQYEVETNGIKYSMKNYMRQYNGEITYHTNDLKTDFLYKLFEKIIPDIKKYNENILLVYENEVRIKDEEVVKQIYDGDYISGVKIDVNNKEVYFDIYLRDFASIDEVVPYLINMYELQKSYLPKNSLYSDERIGLKYHHSLFIAKGVDSLEKYEAKNLYSNETGIMASNINTSKSNELLKLKYADYIRNNQYEISDKTLPYEDAIKYTPLRVYDLEVNGMEYSGEKDNNMGSYYSFYYDIDVDNYYMQMTTFIDSFLSRMPFVSNYTKGDKDSITYTIDGNMFEIICKYDDYVVKKNGKDLDIDLYVEKESAFSGASIKIYTSDFCKLICKDSVKLDVVNAKLLFN